MANLTTKSIRNVALLGHGGSGKTSLAEAMLYLTKATDRLGNPTDGNTVCDYDDEEIKRGLSISTSVAPVMWNGIKINLLADGEEIAEAVITAENGWKYLDAADVS